MGDEKTNKLNLGWPSEALIVGVAGALAYATTYSYKLGYLNHYGIPIEFLHPSIGEMIFPCIFVFLIACLTIVFNILILGIFDSTYNFYKNRLEKIRKQKSEQEETSIGDQTNWVADLRTLFAAAIPVVTACILLSWKYTAITFMFSFLHFSVNYQWSSTKKTNSSDQALFVFVRLTRKFGFLVLSWLFLFLIYAMFLGEKSAQNKNEYLVPDFNNNAIVVKLNADEAIAQKVDRNRKCLIQEYFLFKLQGEDGKPVFLRRERFEKLKKCK